MAQGHIAWRVRAAEGKRHRVIQARAHRVRILKVWVNERRAEPAGPAVPFSDIGEKDGLVGDGGGSNTGTPGVVIVSPPVVPYGSRLTALLPRLPAPVHGAQALGAVGAVAPLDAA